MKGVPTFFDSSENLEYESIATAMFSSNSPEELLKIFLTSLGERLAVSRIAIYQLTNQNEGSVLVEAISPNIQNIKNQTYPISYFGVDSLQNYPCDRVVKLFDRSQTMENLNIDLPWQETAWQETEIKSMMSAPIVFNSLAYHKIWGLAFVQQCDRPRQWQPQEANFLFELSQILGQCLQSWELSLRSPTLLADRNLDNEAHDQEEFIATRLAMSENIEVISTQPDLATNDIALLNNFILSGDEENEVLDRSRIKDNTDSINRAVNLAMQRLEQKVQYLSSPYPRVFTEIDTPQDMYVVDLESTTLEDVLEVCSQDQPQSKVDYLQQKVGELIESMQQKINEITLLQQQVQELTASQQEFRQILLDLQSENLTQNIKDAVIEMYRSLSSK